MKRTTTGVYEISGLGDHGVDADEVEAALAACPLLDYAALALDHSVNWVHGPAILKAKSLIDALKTEISGQSIDLTTVVSLLSRDLELVAADIAFLQGLIVDYPKDRTGDRYIKVRGNRNHLEISFSACRERARESFEVSFDHTNPVHWTSRNGLFFPITITVQVWTNTAESGVPAIKDVQPTSIQKGSDFDLNRIREWIHRSILGPEAYDRETRA